MLAAAVHGCPEEMRTGVDACGINVIVLNIAYLSLESKANGILP